MHYCTVDLFIFIDKLSQIGIEFQETYLMLSSKNTRSIKPGMAFNILVGFQNLELKEEPKDPKNKVYACMGEPSIIYSNYRYSMLLADTVLVSESGEQEILTGSISKRFGDVSYFIEVATPPLCRSCS
jgi:nucleosome binding factor SPN SPT16 subunit